MTTREALDDVILPGELLIPQGAVVYIDIRGIQRDPDYWQDPEAFVPERFLDKVGAVNSWKKFTGAVTKGEGG
jgi:cytochrome P450